MCVSLASLAGGGAGPVAQKLLERQPVLQHLQFSIDAQGALLQGAEQVSTTGCGRRRVGGKWLHWYACTGALAAKCGFQNTYKHLVPCIEQLLYLRAALMRR